MEKLNKGEEFAQWAADTERLLISAYSSGEGLIDYDEEAEETVKERCIKRLGPLAGFNYFCVLVATLPERRPDLFPELADFPKTSPL